MFLVGGVVGVMFWVFVYFIDVIKSVIQIDDYWNFKYFGIMDVFRKIFVIEGVKGLYRGFGFVMVCSVFVNVVCFLVYELVREVFG